MCPFNNIARHISTSGTAQTVAKPARLKPIRKCSYSIPGKDYLKFSILLQKHSSPGTVHLTDYRPKRLHISASRCQTSTA